MNRISQGRLPVVATIIVLLAVGTMVGLGVWQLQRLAWKEDLLARYAQAETLNSDVGWSSDPAQRDRVLYRHSRLDCVEVTGMQAIAGRSAQQEAGWAHLADCRLPGGDTATVAIGWSRDPASPAWGGGEVAGFVGPMGEGVKLVVAPAQAGLGELAAPDPADVPNNHLAYAVQWFLFAATALVIYALALRKKWRGEG